LTDSFSAKNDSRINKFALNCKSKKTARQAAKFIKSGINSQCPKVFFAALRSWRLCDNLLNNSS
jgi:hypothetical protein